MAVTFQKKERKDAFKRLRDLGDERLQRVEHLLMVGVTVSDVATMIQVEWGECTDIKKNTVIKQLTRYKEKVLDPKLALASKSITDERKTEILDRLDEQLDVMAELNELAVLQKSRIKKVMLKEKDMPLIFTWLNNEMRNYRDTLSEIGRLQLETGALQRVGRNFSGKFTFESRSKILELQAESADQDTITEITEELMAEFGVLALPEGPGELQ